MTSHQMSYSMRFEVERTIESHHLKEHDAHRPHIRRLAVRLSPDELRRHVGGGAAIRLRQVLWPQTCRNDSGQLEQCKSSMKSLSHAAIRHPAHVDHPAACRAASSVGRSSLAMGDPIAVRQGGKAQLVELSPQLTKARGGVAPRALSFLDSPKSPTLMARSEERKMLPVM